jgi:hypothetical protein
VTTSRLHKGPPRSRNSLMVLNNQIAIFAL